VISPKPTATHAETATPASLHRVAVDIAQR
jgi:hypothetical protein